VHPAVRVPDAESARGVIVARGEPQKTALVIELVVDSHNEGVELDGIEIHFDEYGDDIAYFYI